MASQRTPLYHYRVKDKIVGPICLTDLHALLVSKKILPDTMIREEHSQCWMPLATELRRQERLARLRASAFMLSCRPPKSCLLFYIIALLLLACGVAHSIMLHTILYM
ncbi:GYF domain-containing protein, partial [Akkermansia sp.]